MPSEQPKDPAPTFEKHVPDLFQRQCERVLEALLGVHPEEQVRILEEIIQSIRMDNNL
jgi:hypothetical protein